MSSIPQERMVKKYWKEFVLHVQGMSIYIFKIHSTLAFASESGKSLDSSKVDGVKFRIIWILCS